MVKRFESGKSPLTSEEISNLYHIPIKLTGQILYLLVKINILIETATDDERVLAYQPAMDINRITVGLLLSRIDRLGSEN